MNRMINAAFCVVLVVVFVVEEHSLVLPHRDWLLDALTGLVVGACAVAREWNRFLLALAGLAAAGVAEVVAECCHLPGEPGAAATLALMMLIGSAVRVLDVRPAVTIAAGGAAVFAGMATTHSDLGSLAIQLWLLAVAVGFCLRLLDARRRTMIETIRRGERLDLARELHDAAAHHMTGVVLQAQAARVIARRDPAALDGALDGALAGIEAASTDALTSMRQVIGVLREPDHGGGRRPGHEDLAKLVHRFGPSVRLCLPDGPADPDWPAEVSSTIYRVVQEALTNVIRHAPDASDVSVTLAHDPRSVTVRVSNDRAQRHAKPGGYGLIGMRERVEAVGGKFTAGPDGSDGWTVLATLPRARVGSP